LGASKPKPVKPPPPPPPQAIPETAPETEETAAKKVRKAMGYQRQILAGGLAPKSKGLG
jgi:hypothetical protein